MSAWENAVSCALVTTQQSFWLGCSDCLAGSLALLLQISKSHPIHTRNECTKKKSKVRKLLTAEAEPGS